MRFWGIILAAYFLVTNALAALPPDIERDVKRFIQKSPSVNGLRVEIEFLDANLSVPACLGGTIEIS